MNDGSVGGVTAAMKPASAAIGSGLLALVVAAGACTRYGVLCGNHATPSFTSAKLRRYAPGVGGAATVAVRLWLPPTATSASSGVRGPSHMTPPPTASYQW